ncbi:hypothetical protein, partial [Geobacillus stearothermophilus]|nr:hypothetical protein [Geobacillus stearothermophilus]
APNGNALLYNYIISHVFANVALSSLPYHIKQKKTIYSMIFYENHTIYCYLEQIISFLSSKKRQKTAKNGPAMPFLPKQERCSILPPNA